MKNKFWELSLSFKYKHSKNQINASNIDEDMNEIKSFSVFCPSTVLFCHSPKYNYESLGKLQIKIKLNARPEKGKEKFIWKHEVTFDLGATKEKGKKWENLASGVTELT